MTLRSMGRTLLSPHIARSGARLFSIGDEDVGQVKPCDDEDHSENCRITSNRVVFQFNGISQSSHVAFLSCLRNRQLSQPEERLWIEEQ